MKKLVLNFANNLLSKEQMKNVKGGTIYCTITTDGVQTSGACGSSDMNDCYAYSTDYCSQQYEYGVSSCSYSCS